MHLVLTGSGPAGPAGSFPEAGCGCARCRWVAKHERSRTPLSLMLPGGRILDGGTPAAVIAAGVGSSSRSLLWAPDGVLPAGAAPPVDVAVLTPAPDDASLTSLGHTIAAARAAGTIGPDTRTVLAGLGHRHPRADRLAPVLAAWGVHRPDDRTDLELLPPLQRITGRTLVLGGASSGKSALAEALLAAEPDVVYLATGPAPDSTDTEWATRVRAHRERRPDSWKTVETPDAASTFDEPGAVLLDAVGTWLTAALDEVGAWQQAPGWRERLAPRVEGLVEAWRCREGPLVAVSDEVGLGVVPGTAAGRIFREELGGLNARLAEESERVVLVVAGRATDIMGA